ncbi:hypothetical protein FQN50_001844 [Emmonsiellopsis sp. PD_5]|nr:hypothetical protein FQN50_001844 [Emmonsiellopsis sp. PD_5]
MHLISHSLSALLLTSLLPLTLANPIIQKRADIPGPPTDPPQQPGDGSGEYNSIWLCSPNDWKVHTILKGGVVAFTAKGWIQSARAMNHYLGESGDDLDVNVQTMMKSTPAFKDAIHALAEKTVKHKLDTFVGPWVDLPFVSAWTVWHAWNDAANAPHNYDWYYALGEYSYAVSGVISRAKNGDMTVRWKAHAFDRYNWDNSNKKNNFGWGVELSHAEIGHLHKCGSAQEYTVRGSSKEQVTKNYDSKKGVLAPVDAD